MVIFDKSDKNNATDIFQAIVMSLVGVFVQKNCGKFGEICFLRTNSGSNYLYYFHECNTDDVSGQCLLPKS